jgi:uncharacterized protein YjbI with pentapeptide repeats
LIFQGLNLVKGRFFFQAQFGEGNVDFSRAQFGEGDVDFSGIQFGDGDVDFSRTKFGKGEVNFSFSRIHTDLNLGKVKAEKINLTASIIHGTIDLLGSDLNKLVLAGTKLSGRLFIGSKELKLSKSHISDDDVINSQENLSPEWKAYYFRLLKENFRNLGQYDDEDRAYVQFKRNELMYRKEQIGKKLWLYLNHYISKIIYQDIGLFGTAPFRVFQTMIATVISFTMIYFLSFWSSIPFIGSLGDGPLGNVVSWKGKLLYSFYHSAVTFLTIGYGDIQPNGWGIFWSAIEGFMGLFLMSYFTVAFVRKVLR